MLCCLNVLGVEGEHIVAAHDGLLLKKFQNVKSAFQYLVDQSCKLGTRVFVRDTTYTTYTLSTPIDRTMQYVNYLRTLWPECDSKRKNAKALPCVRIVMCHNEQLARALIKCMPSEPSTPGIWVTRDVMDMFRTEWLENEQCQLWYLGEYNVELHFGEKYNSVPVHLYDFLRTPFLYASAYTAFPETLSIKTFGYKHAYVGKLCIVAAEIFGYNSLMTNGVARASVHAPSTRRLSSIMSSFHEDRDINKHDTVQTPADSGTNTGFILYKSETADTHIEGEHTDMRIHHSSQSRSLRRSSTRVTPPHCEKTLINLVQPLKQLLKDLCSDTHGVLLPFDEASGSFVAVFPGGTMALAWITLVQQGLEIMNWKQDVSALDHAVCEPMVIKNRLLPRGPKLKFGVDKGNAQIDMKRCVDYRGSVIERAKRIAHATPVGHVYCSPKFMHALDSVEDDSVYGFRKSTVLPQLGLCAEMQLYDVQESNRLLHCTSLLDSI